MQNKVGFVRVLRAITVIAVLALLVAACAQTTQAPAAPTPSAPAPAAQPTAAGAAAPQGAGEIKMGLLLALTGDLGDLGTAQVPAVDMAVKEMNAAGGPLGRKVVLATEDEKSNAQAAVAGAKKLVYTDKAITLIGLSSNGIVALLDFARSNKVPVMSHYGGTVKLDTEGGNYVYRAVTSDSFAGIASAKFLADKGYKTAANLYENGESPESNAKTMEAEFKKYGGQVVSSVAFNPGQTSYQAELKKVFDSKPEIVLLSAGQESAATILKEWYRANYGGQWLLGSDLGSSEFVKQVGAEVMKGMYGQAAGDDVNSPSFKRFQQLWKQATGKDEVAPYASNIYDSFIVEGLAMEAGKAATGEAINANMRKVTSGSVKVMSFEQGVAELRKGSSIAYQGVSGPLDFDEHGNVTGPWTILQAEGDHWKEYKFYTAQDLMKK